MPRSRLMHTATTAGLIVSPLANRPPARLPPTHPRPHPAQLLPSVLTVTLLTLLLALLSAQLVRRGSMLFVAESREREQDDLAAPFLVSAASTGSADLRAALLASSCAADSSVIVQDAPAAWRLHSVSEHQQQQQQQEQVVGLPAGGAGELSPEDSFESRGEAGGGWRGRDGATQTAEGAADVGRSRKQGSDAAMVAILLPMSFTAAGAPKPLQPAPRPRVRRGPGPLTRACRRMPWGTAPTARRARSPRARRSRPWGRAGSA